MLQVGRTQSTLEPLGAFLASRDAREIEISDEGPFLAVSWQPTDSPRERRCFDASDLEQLRQVTRDACPPARGRAVFLGALGREIDRARVDVTRITEDARGFVVSGTSGGRYVSWRCAPAELARPEQPAPPPRVEPVSATPSRASTVLAPPDTTPAAVADPHASPLRHRLQLSH